MNNVQSGNLLLIFIDDDKRSEIAVTCELGNLFDGEFMSVMVGGPPNVDAIGE